MLSNSVIFNVFTLTSLLLGQTYAQNGFNATSQIPPNSPKCVAVCVDAKIAQMGALAPRAQDFSQACQVVAFQQAYSTCISQNCASRDVNTAQTAWNAICAAADALEPSSQPTPTINVDSLLQPTDPTCASVSPKFTLPKTRRTKSEYSYVLKLRSPTPQL